MNREQFHEETIVAASVARSQGQFITAEALEQIGNSSRCRTLSTAVPISVRTGAVQLKVHRKLHDEDKLLI